jgi:hypothetical protein
VESDPSTDPGERFDQVELLLAERGHDLASGRIRVAAGRSGVAAGFPTRPLIHVSWWALAPVVLFAVIRRNRRRATRA